MMLSEQQALSGPLGWRKGAMEHFNIGPEYAKKLSFAIYIVASILTSVSCTGLRQQPDESPIQGYLPNVVYVSTEGDDTSNGTKSSPLRSITEALKRLRKGGTLYVMQGTYRESSLHLTLEDVTIEGLAGEDVYLKG